jgi:2-dehydropantoate 2-reductase
MRVAIFGAGAVGAYVGGRLAQTGVPVAFLARGDHLHALARLGVRVDSPQGDFVVRPWLVTDDPTAVGIVDVVIVGVKTWQLPEVARALPALVGPDTCVVPLQNGVAQFIAVCRRAKMVAMGTRRPRSGLRLCRR